MRQTLRQCPAHADLKLQGCPGWAFIRKGQEELTITLTSSLHCSSG
jgi:hypothetical protein